MSISTMISVGEFLDKLTILEIKLTEISDPAKRINISKEHSCLQDIWGQSRYAQLELTEERTGLKQINETLWKIEDEIREKEKRKQFDQVFIELARSVYVTNDKRANIKRKINEKTGSGLVEEKSYKEY